MKKTTLDLMEKILSAYTDEHIKRYFDEVKQNGLTEHGFPRLTVNIGILIAHGVRLDLMPLFLEMMEFCCKTIPLVKATNDFSVREIICCIWELDRSGAVDSKDIARWKEYLTTIEPEKCYTQFAKKPTDPVRNWALFTCVSEFFRQSMGLCDSSEFIDVQIASQLQWIDENGMYMDNSHSEARQPIVYDLAPRVLFSVLLRAGYRGKYYSAIDNILRKAGLLTLHMQSVTGEIAFGGRSNQFLLNEPLLAAVFEFEAARYKKEGNFALSGQFKAAALQAMKPCEDWLAKKPIRHVKNRFPTETKFGCEQYAYFDKYMITFASNLYLAVINTDDSIEPSEFIQSPMIWSTSEHFHKTFVRAGGYFLEFDTNADPHYDANGLGRIHKENAPSTLCLSTPFAKEPNFGLNGFENKSSFSVCPAIKDENGAYIFGSECGVSYDLTKSRAQKEDCFVSYDCVFENGKKVNFSCNVNKNGVSVRAEGNENEEIAVCLPVFCFDGEVYTNITALKNKILVEYDGWICEYSADNLTFLNQSVANRNGIYKCFLALGCKIAEVKIKLYKA